jgi:hypothetical protein
MKCLLTYLADLLRPLWAGDGVTARAQSLADTDDDGLPSALRTESFYWTWPYWRPL